MDLMLLATLSVLPYPFTDPAPSVTRGKKHSRELVCQRMSVEQAAQLRPGLVFRSKPRGDYVERSVVLCTQRFVRPGLRSQRDEAVLTDLDAHSSEAALAVTSLRPDLEDATWLVEAFYPDAQVSAKLSFATKNALMNQGLSVSDRVPTLAAGDVDVLTRMSPDEAYPAACLRYHTSGSLSEGDVLLAVVSRDPRETALHVGLCAGGRWSWVR